MSDEPTLAERLREWDEGVCTDWARAWSEMQDAAIREHRDTILGGPICTVDNDMELWAVLGGTDEWTEPL